MTGNLRRMAVLDVMLAMLLLAACASGVREEKTIVESKLEEASSSYATSEKAAANTLSFVYPMKNASRTAGEALKLKCEVVGSPPATEFRDGIHQKKIKNVLLELFIPGSTRLIKCFLRKG